MRLFDIIWKEISIIKSQKIALLLIFLYPLLAIMLLGLAMSGTSLNEMPINVGLVNNMSEDFNLIGKITDQRANLHVVEFSDVNDLKLAVKKKEVMIGLVAKSVNKLPIFLDLYYDNSNVAAGGTFRAFTVSTIGLIELDIVKSNFSSILDIIFDLKKNLGSQLDQIDEFKNKLKSSGEELDKLEAKLNAFDISEIENTLNEQEGNIDDFETKNQEFLSELNNFKISFSKVKSEINELNNSLEEYDEDLNTLSTQMNTISSELGNIITNYGSVLGAEGINDLQEQKDEVDKLRSTIIKLQAALSEITNEQSTLNTTISDADDLFITLEEESKNVSEVLASSSDSISNMNDDLIVFKDSLDEVRALITSAKISKVEIESKLNSSQNLLGDLVIEMDKLDSFDKSILADPIKITEKRLFSPQSLGYMLAPIDPLLIGGVVANAISIVLIMTCLLLTSIIVILERKENVALRFALSPTSKFELVIGKIIGQLIIALTEATIIFLIAIFIFGSDLITRFVEIYFLTILISIAFICLGLLVSSFTKTQSTAILLSLLAIIPMLFLSGIIVPLDLMSPIMQLASIFLPLTAANNLLIGVIVKDLAIIDMAVELAVIITIILAGLMVVLLKDDF